MAGVTATAGVTAAVVVPGAAEVRKSDAVMAAPVDPKLAKRIVVTGQEVRGKVVKQSALSPKCDLPYSHRVGIDRWQ